MFVHRLFFISKKSFSTWPTNRRRKGSYLYQFRTFEQSEGYETTYIPGRRKSLELMSATLESSERIGSDRALITLVNTSVFLNRWYYPIIDELLNELIYQTWIGLYFQLMSILDMNCRYHIKIEYKISRETKFSAIFC